MKNQLKQKFVNKECKKLTNSELKTILGGHNDQGGIITNDHRTK